MKIKLREDTSIMTIKPTSGVSAEFGYYPATYNINTERFSIQTLPSFASDVIRVKNDPNVYKDWIYPGASVLQDFMSGEIRSLPYNQRIFGLPKTHVVMLHQSENSDDLDFVVWCLSFFTGMRLTITEAGFIDATPIKPGKLVDFVLCCTLEDVINLALDYLESERDNFRATKRVIAAIHSLFLAQLPQNLPFERFQYLYMGLDTCYKLVEAKSEPKPKRRLSHAERVQWMCEKFDIPVPDWATIIDKSSQISTVRNDTIHEALFFDEPLGFSIYGGNQPIENSGNVILQMQHLVCRLVVAILGKSETNYVKTRVDTRQYQSLKLHEV